MSHTAYYRVTAKGQQTMSVTLPLREIDIPQLAAYRSELRREPSHRHKKLANKTNSNEVLMKLQRNGAEAGILNLSQSGLPCRRINVIHAKHSDLVICHLR